MIEHSYNCIDVLKSIYYGYHSERDVCYRNQLNKSNLYEILVYLSDKRLIKIVDEYASGCYGYCLTGMGFKAIQSLMTIEKMPYVDH